MKFSTSLILISMVATLTVAMPVPADGDVNNSPTAADLNNGDNSLSQQNISKTPQVVVVTPTSTISKVRREENDLIGGNLLGNAIGSALNAVKGAAQVGADAAGTVAAAVDGALGGRVKELPGGPVILPLSTGTGIFGGGIF